MKDVPPPAEASFKALAERECVTLPKEWLESMIAECSAAMDAPQNEFKKPDMVRFLGEELFDLAEQFETVVSLPAISHSELEALRGETLSEELFRTEYLIRLDLEGVESMYPRFQFDSQGAARDCVVTLNMRFDVVKYPWEAAFFWTLPADVLDGISPMSFVELGDDPTGLLEQVFI